MLLQICLSLKIYFLLSSEKSCFFASFLKSFFKFSIKLFLLFLKYFVCYNSNVLIFILGFFLKKIFFMLLMLNIYLIGAEIENRLIITIPKQDSQTLKIPALNLKVGESGIITRDIDTNEFIIGNAIVNSIDDGIASLEIRPFETIKERYMPTPLGNAQEKDKVIFRILYDRALAIAPNQTTYQDILDNNKNIDFTHPDIFASYLATNDENMPNAKDFRGFCDKFNIGLIFIAQESDISILDCQSLKTIAKDSLTLKDSAQNLPFFTRLGDEALRELFSMDKMKEYFDYYKSIVESQNIAK